MSPDTQTKPDLIVVVGAHTVLGELFIQSLEENPAVTKYFVADKVPPKDRSEKGEFLLIDLVEPGADAKLAEIFKRIQTTSIVHCFSKNNPSLNWVYAHELEVIGTLAVVSAAKAAGVRKFVYCSSTVVYGASAKNPNYLSESHLIDSKPEAHFVKDKVDAEKQVASLFQDAPQMLVTVLRFCLVVGPNSRNYFTEFLRRPIVPSLLGYDPLMQFIHETDAISALVQAVFQDYRGYFNIVGRGVVPLSYALRKARRVKMPVASLIAYPLTQILWNLQLVSVPGKLLDFFRYLWVADGEKAKKVMGFTSRYTSKEAYLDFAQAQLAEEELQEVVS